MQNHYKYIVLLWRINYLGNLQHKGSLLICNTYSFNILEYKQVFDTLQQYYYHNKYR